RFGARAGPPPRSGPLRSLLRTGRSPSATTRQRALSRGLRAGARAAHRKLGRRYGAVIDSSIDVGASTLREKRARGGHVRKAWGRLPRVGVRRGIRATFAGAGTFSFVYEVMHNPTAAIFAAFGSVILLVYVEFSGPKRQRFEQHVGLIVMTFFFVFLGTVCSQVLWLAVASTLVVCFCVLMSGVISASLAGATS